MAIILMLKLRVENSFLLTPMVAGHPLEKVMMRVKMGMVSMVVKILVVIIAMEMRTVMTMTLFPIMEQPSY